MGQFAVNFLQGFSGTLVVDDYAGFVMGSLVQDTIYGSKGADYINGGLGNDPYILGKNIPNVNQSSIYNMAIDDPSCV